MAKMDKRACRKVADPGLTIPSNNGMLYAEQLCYIVRTQIKVIGGSRLLVLYIYDRQDAVKGDFRPAMTMFQSKTEFATLDRRPDDSLAWRSSPLDRMRKHYHFTKKCVFYSLKDSERVTRFCGDKNGETGFDALHCLQDRIKTEQLVQRTIAKERKIKAVMDTVGGLPSYLTRWVDRELLDAYIFYDYSRRKTTDGFCSACNQDVVVAEPRHNKPGKCPNCNRDVIFKALGKAKHVWDRKTGIVIQKTKNGELVVRIIKATASYSGLQKQFGCIYENARIFVHWTPGEQRCFFSPYYLHYEKHLVCAWKPGMRPVINKWVGTFDAEICGHLYCANLDKVLSDTPWRYSQLAAFYRTDKEPMEVTPYLSSFLSNPFIEYMVKLGLTRLTGDLVYSNSYTTKDIFDKSKRCLHEVLGVSLDDLHQLQAINPDRGQFELFQVLRKGGYEASPEICHWFGKHKLRLDDFRFIIGYLAPHKLMAYANEQYEALKDVRGGYGGRRYEGVRRIVSEYQDYLEDCEFLGYDMTDDFILCPRNLMEAHDQTSLLRDAKKLELYREKFHANHPKLTERYGFQYRGLELRVPVEPEDIANEGNTLHHCVKNYVDRVAKGRCIILFLRRESNPEKPFYTVELRDQEIVQTRGRFNCEPTAEVKRFLRVFEQRKLLAPVQMPAAA